MSSVAGFEYALTLSNVIVIVPMGVTGTSTVILNQCANPNDLIVNCICTNIAECRVFVSE